MKTRLRFTNSYSTNGYRYVTMCCDPANDLDFYRVDKPTDS